MNQKKPKLLWLSDDMRLKHVGQSIVSREVLTRLLPFYEIEGLGLGGAHVPDPEPVSFNIIPCYRNEMQDPAKLIAYIKQSNPDVFLFSHDFWIGCGPILPELRSALPNVKFMAYLTVDSEPVYYAWRRGLESLHKIIVPSQWSKRVLTDRFCNLNVDVVPYGVDHNYFRPCVQGKEQLKREIHQTYAQNNCGYLDISDKFLAVFVGANQQRKNLGLIHEAWVQFEKQFTGNKPIRLVSIIHSASLVDPNAGDYDLSVFLHDSTTIRIINNVIPTAGIGQFMAAADVLLHPAMAGGFELTVAEAMACGTVPIVIPYSAVTDYCTNDNSYQIPFMLHTGQFHAHVAVAPVENVVQCLNDACNNPQERIVKANNAIQTAKQFTWESTAEGVKRNIDEVLAMDPNGLYMARLV